MLRGVERSAAAGFVGQGHGAEVKDLAIVNEFGLDLPLHKHLVCSRVAVNGEGAVSVFIQLDECQGGGSGPIHGQTGTVNPVLDQHAAQKIPEGIRANLADEGGLSAQARHHCQHIGGRAAGILRKQLNAPLVFPAWRKVDQQLAYRRDIAHAASPFLTASSSW